MHRHLQAGIVGRSDRGAESIVLSGGYVDDEDDGHLILYTGHGGRDANSGRQVQDQEFTAQNRALVVSCQEGLPVRVVRGAAHRSPHAPASGYRYDGLFYVDDFWRPIGRDGFRICRFRLVKDLVQRGGQPDTSGDAETGAERRETTIQRIVRDTQLGRTVKEMYDYRCQVCGLRLEANGVPYAEAAHIRPLGRPHDGPDILGNVLCLCPNHHVLFDIGAFSLDRHGRLYGLGGTMELRGDHVLDQNCLDYRHSLR